MNDKQTEITAATYGIAKIKFIVDDTYHLLMNDQLVPARKAVSCLLKPQIDDLVQILCHPQHSPYILTVLERENTAKMDIDFGFDKDVVVRGKNLHLESSESIHVNTGRYHTQADRINFEGKQLTTHCMRITTTAEYADQCFETLTTQANRSFHWIKQLKHSVISTMRTIVHHSSRIDCNQYEIYSENDAKIKAKQIHLG